MEPARPIVLVVEDDRAMSRLLRRLLEDAGYTVEVAADGAAGLARLQAGGIDLVLLDLMLPGLDGFQLCRKVRAQENEIYLPIIMLTGMASDKARHAGFAAGADDYVIKPFNSEELLDRVAVWVRTRQCLKASHESKREQSADDQSRLAMALTLSHDLTRLLMLLLSLVESWEASNRSATDPDRLITELREAAVALAARINLLTGATGASTAPASQSSPDS